jgi:hypothetical protein
MLRFTYWSLEKRDGMGLEAGIQCKAEEKQKNLLLTKGELL